MASISSFNSVGTPTKVKKEVGLNEIKAPNPTASAKTTVKAGSTKLNTTTTGLNQIEAKPKATQSLNQAQAPQQSLNQITTPKPKVVANEAYLAKNREEGGKPTDIGTGEWIVSGEPKPKTPTPIATEKQPAKEAAPVAEAGAVAGESNAIADDAANASRDALKQVDDLKEAGLDAEEDLMQDSVELANNSYEQDMERYNQLKAQQDSILAQRNSLEAESSDFQKQKIEQSYQDTLTQMEIQQERMDKAYQDQILSQKSANTKRTLQAENRIAALGGYGDLQKGKELQGLTIENDSLLNSIVFEKNTTNKEMSLQYKQLNDSYTNSIKEVELSKNQAVQGNYEQYLDYVSKITEAQDLSQQRKDELILGAKKEYTKQVGEINQTAFTQRYEISRDAAETARQMKNEQKEDARVVLEDMLTTFSMSNEPLTDAQKKQITQLEAQAGLPTGYNMTKLETIKAQAAAQDLEIKTEIDDYENYNVIAINKSTGAVENFQTLEGVGKTNMEKSAFKLDFNPITGETILFDPATGTVQSLGGSAGADPNQFMNGFYSEGTASVSPPAGTLPVGDQYIPESNLNSVFKVGQAVGWCGVFSSQLSTGPAVGNTWSEKKSKIVKQDNPTAGNKLLIPLGVKTDKDYGHVATVLSFDPATGNILVNESNKDGRQNRGEGLGVSTIGTYNINDLKAKYGANFGFTNGELKPEIQAQLNKVGVPATQPSTGGGAQSNDTASMVAKAYQAAGKPISNPKALNQAIATYNMTGILPQPDTKITATPNYSQADNATYNKVLSAYNSAGQSLNSDASRESAVATFLKTGYLPSSKAKTKSEIDPTFANSTIKRLANKELTADQAMAQINSSYPQAERGAALELLMDSISKTNANRSTVFKNEVLAELKAGKITPAQALKKLTSGQGAPATVTAYPDKKSGGSVAELASMGYL